MFNELVGAKGLSSLRDHLSNSEKVAYMRAKAIGMTIDEAVEVFATHQEDLLGGKPLGELASLIPSADKLGALKAQTKSDVFSMPNVLQIEAAGFEIIGGLLDVFVMAIDGAARPSKKPGRDLFGNKVLKLIPEEFVGPNRKPDPSPYERLLLAIDFVSGMTDSFALDLFRKLRGVTIPR